MSWLSSLTGVHISPKGVKIEPLKALGTAATIATLGGAGPLAAAATKIPGVAALGKIPGVSKLGGLVSKIPGASAIGGFLKGHGDELLTAAQGLNAANQMSHANALENKALGYATDSYDQRAPLRNMALTRLTAPDQLPDLSGIYSDPGNPYSKRRVTPMGGA